MGTANDAPFLFYCHWGNFLDLFACDALEILLSLVSYFNPEVLPTYLTAVIILQGTTIEIEN